MSMPGAQKMKKFVVGAGTATNLGWVLTIAAKYVIKKSDRRQLEYIVSSSARRCDAWRADRRNPVRIRGLPRSCICSCAALRRKAAIVGKTHEKAGSRAGRFGRFSAAPGCMSQKTW